MAKRNEAKLTAWTDSGMRVDVNGPITGIAIELYGLLTDKQKARFAEKTKEGEE